MNLAPLLTHKLIEPANLIIDAKTGSPAGRGGGDSKFGYAESNKNVHVRINRWHVEHLLGLARSTLATTASI